MQRAPIKGGTMAANICVYGASSDALHDSYYQAAHQLGGLLAGRGDTLIFGAGCLGIMGAAARGAHQHGGRVVGIIPKYLRKEGICYEQADELIVTKDIRERKAVMESLADAFIALPGGFGTLEELMEILTLKQLRIHQKPIVLLDTNGFFDPLKELFEHIYRERFVKPHYRSLYHFAPTPQDALEYIDTHPPEELEEV